MEFVEATIDEALEVCTAQSAAQSVKSEAAMLLGALLVITEAEAVEAHSIAEATCTAADSEAKCVGAYAGPQADLHIVCDMGSSDATTTLATTTTQKVTAAEAESQAEALLGQHAEALFVKAAGVSTEAKFDGSVSTSEVKFDGSVFTSAAAAKVKVEAKGE